LIMVGPLSWGKGQVRNVAKCPLVGGQWLKGQGEVQVRPLDRQQQYGAENSCGRQDEGDRQLDTRAAPVLRAGA
jgi:hypothetical protein